MVGIGTPANYVALCTETDCGAVSLLAFRRDEALHLPAQLDYEAVHGLSSEAVQKLSAVRPVTLGQAARIDGVTPAALTLVLAHVRANRTATAPVL